MEEVQEASEAAEGDAQGEEGMKLRSGTQVYQGHLCIRGHDGTRYVKGRGCVECVAERYRKNYDPAKALEYRKRFHERHPDYQKETWRRYARRKTELIPFCLECGKSNTQPNARFCSRRCRSVASYHRLRLNPEKLEKMKKKQLAWREKNREKLRAAGLAQYYRTRRGTAQYIKYTREAQNKLRERRMSALKALESLGIEVPHLLGYTSRRGYGGRGAAALRALKQLGIEI